MFRKTRLFTPGPTPLLPAAQFAMAAADLHHRTPEFRALFSRVLKQLQAFIGTKHDVIVLSASGTGAMEAALTNLTSPGDEVLVLSAGKFGERWASLAKAFHCAPKVVKKSYGQTFTAADLTEALTGNTRAVFLQATETSTGVRHDVPAIAQALRGRDILLIVDAITGLGTTRFDVDGDGIDVIIGGSQKAVMIPPGLSYMAVSDRAWQRMEASTQPRYYFDLRKERKSAASGESAYTPPVALIAALGAALDYIGHFAGGDVARGRELLVDNAELCAAATRAAAQSLRLELFAAESPSAAVTALRAPQGIPSTAVVKRLKEQFAGVVADGQGEMKGELFRIAHLGYLDYLDTVALIAALEIVLQQLGVTGFALGDGVAAAQRVFQANVQQADGARA